MTTLTQAIALHQASQLAEAERAYRELLATNPSDADAASYLGVLLHQLRRSDEALDLLHRAAALRPNDPSIQSNLGIGLTGARRLTEAEQAFRVALALDTDFLPALLNLAKLLLKADKLPEAREAYDAARRRHPESADAWSGLGDAYQAMHDVRAAAAYRQAIKLTNSPAARLGLASIYLLAGQLAEGWPLYEARWELSGRSPSAGFDKPPWDGSDLHGKTILLHAEQGLGDVIQFVRYVPLVKARGGTTVVVVPSLLEKLLTGQTGIDRVATDHNSVRDFDVQCPLLSLPGVFGTTLATIPNNVPYLGVDARKIEHWHSRLGTSKPRIGLVWAGSPQHENDAKRSIAFTEVQPLLHTVDAEWISLQVERGQQHDRLIDWTKELKDLTDTAALISNLDLVISVDTAVAHLAGAVGKPAWLLLPYSPDWRWMWDREDSPWYPSMRLFRQTVPGDWLTPIQRVALALHQHRHMVR